MSIGKRATAMLIVATQGFKNTVSHRQLVSFAGLAPVQKSSGTSIKGRPSISRQGGKELRDVLYMCAMNAKKNNIACKALYDRLIVKGKSSKLALIAVCNKLLTQVFAVVKNNTIYQPNYCSPKPYNKYWKKLGFLHSSCYAFVLFFSELVCPKFVQSCHVCCHFI